MTDQSSSSNAAPAANPQGAAPGSQPATPPTQSQGSQPGQAQGTAPAPDSQSNNEPVPSFSFGDHLTDDDKAYLKSQGVESFDAEGIKKLVAHHKQLRSKKDTSKEASQSGDLSGAVQQAMGVQPQQQQQSEPAPQPTQMQQAPEQQNPYQQPAQQPQGQSQSATPTAPRLPSEFEVMTMGLSVKTQYPDVDPTDVIKEMGTLGINFLDDNGSLAPSKVMGYAKIVNDRVQKDKMIAELQKPAPSSTPNVKPETIDYSLPTVENMNVQQAQAILLQSNQSKARGGRVHQQYEEAKRLLQSTVK